MPLWFGFAFPFSSLWCRCSNVTQRLPVPCQPSHFPEVIRFWAFFLACPISIWTSCRAPSHLWPYLLTPFPTPPYHSCPHVVLSVTLAISYSIVCSLHHFIKTLMHSWLSLLLSFFKPTLLFSTLELYIARLYKTLFIKFQLDHVFFSFNPFH